MVNMYFDTPKCRVSTGFHTRYLGFRSFNCRCSVNKCRQNIKLVRLQLKSQRPLECLTLWLQTFFIPFRGVEIIFYKSSSGTEFFFKFYGLFWYSHFPGCELKLCPYLQYKISVYTKFFKRRVTTLNFCSYVLNLV